LTFSSKRYKHR